MARALALREDPTLASSATLSSREELLGRYRLLRQVGIELHDQILKHVSSEMLLRQARRLGLAVRNTLLLNDPAELNYAFDLAIYTAPPGRTRAIDRYGRSAQFRAGSDEALMLGAMRAARFSILVIERRHETAGLVATDVFRRQDLWLVDIGMERSIPDGTMIATRLFTPERFAMTAGVSVLLDPEMMLEISDKLPAHLGREELSIVIDDRRFAEAIYRLALADESVEPISSLDLSEDGE